MQIQLLFLLLVTAVQSKNIKSYTNNIHYDVETDYDFYELTQSDSIVFLSKDQLIFNSTQSNLIGNIAIINLANEHFYGSIYDGKKYDRYTQYFANKIPFQQIFKNGIIHAEKKSKCNITDTQCLSKEIDIPFCFGFNTDGTCRNPKSDIMLFDNKYMKISCDNCFVGFAGDVFVDIELAFFKVKKVAIGFKNMYLKGGLGVELDANGRYSYDYNKIYKVLDNLHVMTIPIGPIKLDIFVDFPIDIYLGSSVNAEGQIRIGTNLDVNIGNLYVSYENGKFTHINPKPIMKYEPYFTVKANADINSEFKISPSISIYDGSIFKFNIIANPEAELSALATLSTRKACIDGNYEIKLHANGHVLTEHLPDTVLYDTGRKSFIEKCYQF